MDGPGPRSLPVSTPLQTQRPSAITTPVDFDADGVQHGHLHLPHSHDESAYGPYLDR